MNVDAAAAAAAIVAAVRVHTLLVLRSLVYVFVLVFPPSRRCVRQDFDSRPVEHA